MKDISRLEKLSEKLEGFSEGYAIWLTNDHLYWDKPSKSNRYWEDFTIHNGACKHVEMKWHDACEGTTKGREDEVVLSGEYLITWEEYNDLECGNGKFMYALLKISKTGGSNNV